MSASLVTKPMTTVTAAQTAGQRVTLTTRPCRRMASAYEGGNVPEFTCGQTSVATGQGSASEDSGVDRRQRTAASISRVRAPEPVASPSREAGSALRVRLPVLDEEPEQD